VLQNNLLKNSYFKLVDYSISFNFLGTPFMSSAKGLKTSLPVSDEVFYAHYLTSIAISTYLSAWLLVYSKPSFIVSCTDLLSVTIINLEEDGCHD
jgi:hypothetical protein